MSVDQLQEKIRKMKNPFVLELFPNPEELPPRFTGEGTALPEQFRQYYMALLSGLKPWFPAVRFHYSGFSLLGSEGLTLLAELMARAKNLDYYILLDVPQTASFNDANHTADALFGGKSPYPCDAVVIGAYPGSDVIKPFLTCGRDVFVMARTPNRSAPELQDLLTGSRLVHLAVADMVSRLGSGRAGKFGYSSVGVLGAANSESSTRGIRKKYPELFLLLDGYDYPNSGAKRAVAGFDRLGHGAALCVREGITKAWADAPEDTDALAAASAAAERMKKNLARYLTIL